MYLVEKELVVQRLVCLLPTIRWQKDTVIKVFVSVDAMVFGFLFLLISLALVAFIVVLRFV